MRLGYVLVQLGFSHEDALPRPARLQLLNQLDGRLRQVRVVELYEVLHVGPIYDAVGLAR